MATMDDLAELHGDHGPPPPGDESPASGRDKRKGRRKIQIEYISDKSRRHITFSKRKSGIMKKVSVQP